MSLSSMHAAVIFMTGKEEGRDAMRDMTAQEEEKPRAFQRICLPGTGEGKADGQLVMLGFDIAAFTPASYQRHRL